MPDIHTLIAAPPQLPNLTALATSAGLGLLLSLLLALHFRHYVAVPWQRRQQALTLFPLLSLTMWLVVLLIQHSIALSLGLIGALSVIRFRTPVREAEELAYLFLAVALGIGLGAGQLLATSLCLAFILLSLSAIQILRGRARTGYLLIIKHDGNQPDVPERLAKQLQQQPVRWEWLQHQLEGPASQCCLLLYPARDEAVPALIRQLQAEVPSAHILCQRSGPET